MFEIQPEIIGWLLEADVSVPYQMYRDLLSQDRMDVQERSATEGWGARFIEARNPNGHWGRSFYQPKWTSTHYTLLDLRNLCIPPDRTLLQQSVCMIADLEKGPDGGINPSRTLNNSDVCINGMFLNYASWFKTEEEKLKSVVDFILSQQLPDGGFNCHLNRKGAVHSSLHSTLSVLEGITEYLLNGYGYRIDELSEVERAAREFILTHRFYLSDRTGEIINKSFLILSYPGRWRYDILRALDYFQHSGADWDERMKPAMEIILKKRNKNGTWNLQAKHPGQVHFDMEEPGKPGRCNTLRALRVLKKYG